MDTKEAINYVESKRYTMDYCDNNKLADEVIKLLQRGEKHEAMWGELIERQGWRFYIQDSIHNIFLYDIMNNLKQKYFPKQAEKTITFRIEAPTEDKLGEAINDFEMFWAGYNETKGHCIKYGYTKEGD